MTTIGERIAEAVERRQTSLQKLENEIGRSSGYLSRIVRGERGEKGGMRADTVRRIANALKVNVLWLETGSGPSGLEEDGERYVDDDRRYDDVVVKALLQLGQRKKKVRSEAVERARAEMANSNPTVEQMIERIEQKEHELRATEKGKLASRRIDTRDDDAPPGLRLKKVKRSPQQ